MENWEELENTIEAKYLSLSNQIETFRQNLTNQIAEAKTDATVKAIAKLNDRLDRIEIMIKALIPEEVDD